MERCNTNLLHDINKVGNFKDTLKSLRKGNLNELTFAHLNINSFRKN